MIKNLFLCLLVLILLLKTVSIAMLAQADESPVLIVGVSNQGITFYEQATNGTLQAIGEPLSNFAVETLGRTAEWLTLSEESFAASPDGEYIAFTARRDDESALFLYTIHGRNLIQHPIASYWLLPHWSPNSEAILLSPNSPYWSDEPLPNDYVFEVVTNSLFQITYTVGWDKPIQWSPDGNSLVYLGTCHPETCGNRTSDIYVVNRDGSSRFPITDFPTQLPPNPYRHISVCHLERDSSNQRWYYVMGCGGTLNDPFTYVYSTDINGNNELEIDAEAYLKSTEAGNITFNYGIIKGVHPRPEGVYFSVEFSYYADNDLYPDTANVAQHDWRVLRLKHSGQLETIYQQTATQVNGSGAELTGSVISRNGRRMALLFNHDRAFVIDISNNQNIGTAPSLTEIGQHAVCDVRWLDDERLIYNVGGRWCWGVDIPTPKAVWTLNIITNEVTILTDELEQPAWLLRF